MFPLDSTRVMTILSARQLRRARPDLGSESAALRGNDALPGDARSVPSPGPMVERTGNRIRLSLRSNKSNLRLVTIALKGPREATFVWDTLSIPHGRDERVQLQRSEGQDVAKEIQFSPGVSPPAPQNLHSPACSSKVFFPVRMSRTPTSAVADSKTTRMLSADQLTVGHNSHRKLVWTARRRMGQRIVRHRGDPPKCTLHRRPDCHRR